MGYEMDMEHSPCSAKNVGAQVALEVLPMGPFSQTVDTISEIMIFSKVIEN